MSVFPITFEDKVDSPEFIAWLATFGAEKKMTAAEINLVRDALNELHTTKVPIVGGKIPTEYLPSYVDDVLEFADFDAFPTTGETGKIYVDLETNFTYRWTGSVYVQIGGSIKSRITNTSVSGSYVLNHSLASDWKLTLTGATTLSEINLPTGDDTIEFTLKIFGNFPLTIPAYWTVKGDSYSTTLWNFYAIQIHKGNSPQEATAFLTNL